MSTPEQVLGRCADMLLDEERLRLGYEVLQMMAAMPVKLEAGSIWHLLPMEWYKKWEAYCYADLL